MDAVKYFQIKKRMTKNCNITCSNCELDNDVLSCRDFEMFCTEEAVAIVEKWAKEHPLKTRTQVFFEKFPDAPKHSDGTPRTCAINCGIATDSNLCSSAKCYECWNEPAPEKYQKWGE